jgi:hypothetical protein
MQKFIGANKFDQTLINSLNWDILEVFKLDLIISTKPLFKSD